MKNFIASFITLIFISNISMAQVTNFSMKITGDQSELSRNKNDKMIYKFRLESVIPNDTSVFNHYSVIVKANPKESTMPLSDFDVDFREISLSKIKPSYDFYLILNSNKELDRQRAIQLEIVINSKKDPNLNKIKNLTDNTNLKIEIKPILEDTILNQLNYLAYIGTNFDLVDGIKAKNLFFATNINKLPTFKNKEIKRDFGFNLQLYGNRTLTTTEDLGRQTYREKYVPIANTQTARVHRSEGKLTESRVSDNLGIAFNPIFNFWKLSNPKRTIPFFYSPQLEFIYRRFNSTLTYSEIIPKDTSEVINWRGGNDVFYLTPPVEKNSSDIYDVNLGLLGGLLVHENKSISVRFQFVFGYSLRFDNTRLVSPLGSIDTSFKSKGNIFYGSRFWITEPTTGITLGGEISNNVFKNFQPFYNITLSKALTFKNIGTLFSPITTR